MEAFNTIMYGNILNYWLRMFTKWEQNGNFNCNNVYFTILNKHRD